MMKKMPYKNTRKYSVYANKRDNSSNLDQERPPFPNPKFILILLILGGIGYGIFELSASMINNSDMFILKQVKVEGNRYISSEQIIKEAQLQPGDKIFQIPLEEVTRRIIDIPYLNGVSISRSIPSTIIISVQERQPVAYLVDGKMYMIDETGIILLKKPGMTLKQLPLITGLSVKRLLQDRQPLLEALELVEIIKEIDNSLFHLISEIHIDAEDPTQLYLVKGGARVKLGVDDLPKKIFLFSEFLKRDNIINQLETIKLIDLTFNDRVIVTRKG
jgi:cell division protein FtsQ